MGIFNDFEGDPITSFWGENRFLSNFYMVRIPYDEEVYPSAEHAYVAAKTLDRDVRNRISLIVKPGEAKKFGRKLALRSDWEAVKLIVMLSIVRIKFENPELQHKLLLTGKRELREGNTWNDTYWGVCNGKGENMLGKVLMQVRSELS